MGLSPVSPDRIDSSGDGGCAVAERSGVMLRRDMAKPRMMRRRNEVDGVHTGRVSRRVSAPVLGAWGGNPHGCLLVPPSVSARTCPSGLLSRPQRRTEPRTERGFLSWAADCAPARAARPEGIVEPDMSCAWRVPSVAVDDFDIQRSAVGEPEADAPLIIDADAPLALAIACQSLEPIVRWNLRLLHPHNPIEDGEFSQCDCLDVPKPRNALTVEQGICFAATKRPDGHSPSTIGTR